MDIVTTRWVFWISLCFLMPMPVFGTPWSWLPVAYLLLAFFRDGGALLLLYAAIWGAVLWLPVLGYCHWTRHWEPRVRGSVMAISVLTMLVMFSSIPVYRPLALLGDKPVAFQWLYQ